MELGNAIKTLRKKKNVSQKMLAEMCDISANALCNIESGKSFPGKETINKICKALQIPESYLLLFSLSEEDIPEQKRILYRTLCEPLKEELMRDI
mgnify:CR=1 FL=1